MKVTVTVDTIENLKAEGALIGVFTDMCDATISDLDKHLGGRLSLAAKKADFTGKAGTSVTLDTAGGINEDKVMLVGLGDAKDANEEKVRTAAAEGIKSLKADNVSTVGTSMAQLLVADLSPARIAQAVVEGARLAAYSFDQLKSIKDKKKISQLTLLASDAATAKQMKAGVAAGDSIADAALFARDLINLPGNYCTPTYLADEAKKFAKKLGIKATIFGPELIAKHKMGGLMAVAQGSKEPARFIILEWMKGPKSQKPIVVVGKGLTFDTGGISIKPSASMEDMKMDMSGGAAALGVMRAVASLKLAVNLVVLVPSTENMPSSTAVKPGDVATGLSGVTMEIINTDAEGRLILSDALAYAKNFKPDAIVDMATLTGACMVALGEVATGLFSNDETLVSQITEAGKETGETMWRLPLFPEHEEQIKSDVADIKNVGPRWGGASTAAAFLKKHVPIDSWAHLDIAGTAYTTTPKGYKTKGAIGVGVRSVVRFIEKRTGKSAV
jgi:leucyl aminopeptidase